MSSSQRQWPRREWMQMTGLAAAAYGIGLGAADARTYGVQLYTVREQLSAKAADTLRSIAAIGYREVEVVHGDTARIVGLAKEAGLTPVSLHFLPPYITGNWEPYGTAARGAGRPVPADAPSFDRFAAETRALGFSYAVVAYLMPGERGKDAAAYRAFADQLNRAGEVARREGLTLAYHNHGFEFVPFPDGQRGIDVLASQLDASNVKLELDVFWVAMAGGDPAALITKLGSRVALVHLKDKARGIPQEANEMKVPREAFGEVGSGTLDFPAVLAAASDAGVRHMFVEQDQTPGDPVASLEKSYKYLRTLG